MSLIYENKYFCINNIDIVHVSKEKLLKWRIGHLVTHYFIRFALISRQHREQTIAERSSARGEARGELFYRVSVGGARWVDVPEPRQHFKWRSRAHEASRRSHASNESTRTH